MLILAAEGASAGTGTGAAAVAGLAEQLGENVAIRVIFRAGVAVAAGLIALGILAVERAFGRLALGIDLAAVETGAPIGVAQQLVGARGGLESGLRGGVAGIEVGVMLLGQLAVGSLDLLRGGRR